MNTQIDLTPAQIVDELDKYVIGQNEAKRSVAIALRNRYRRLKLDGDMQKEITPKNILMIGPTGVGKTEIARRLSDVVRAPFVKVEATKFTEVGYIGRDVESMVRDLVEVAIKMVRQQKQEAIQPEAYEKAVDRVVAALVPAEKKAKNHGGRSPFQSMFESMGVDPEALMPHQEAEEDVTDDIQQQRDELRPKVKQGLMDKKEVTIRLEEKSQASVGPMNAGLEQMGIDLNQSLSALQPKKKIERTTTVKEALELLTDEEAEKIVKVEDVQSEAIDLAENSGIIFIDEIDKITSKSNNNSAEVSREGVQRDILPIVEGTHVNTKYGTVKTDHMLFIGSGAFSMSKPSDLIPELQGRFPIRVELDDLSAEDFYRILTEPNNALLKQYEALLATENVNVIFTKEAIQKISDLSFKVNTETENIGARRLHTILEKVLEELLFEAPSMSVGEVTITQDYVDEKVGDIVQDEDLSRYIL